MNKAARKDLLRTIRKSMNRFCSILLIIAIGVGFFAGVRATGTDMRTTANQYYTEQNAMDLQLLSTLGFSDNDVTAIAAVEGVSGVQAIKYVDCLGLCADNFLARAYSLPQNADSEETIDRLRILEGRLPEKADECVVDDNVRVNSGFAVGDTLVLDSAEADVELSNSLERSEYTIVGIVNSPLYIDMTRRGNTTVGDGSLDAYLYLPEENFTAEFYTELHLTYAPAAAFSCYEEGYEAAIDELKEKLEAVEAERGIPRGEEMTLYLQEELPDSRKKLEDAKAELADAKQKLADAEQELADARQKLADAEQDLIDGREELERRKKQYEQYEKEYAEGKAELKAAESQLGAAEIGLAQLNAGEAQLNAILLRMKNLPEGSPLLPILADTMAPMLNELTGTNGKKLNYGDLLYDADGNVTPATVKTTADTLDKYFDNMRSKIDAGLLEYENGKLKLEQSRKDLDYYAAELKRGEKELADGEKELEQAKKDLAEGEITFAEESAEAYIEIADGERKLARAERDLLDAEEMLADMKPAEWYMMSRGDMGLGIAEFGDDAARMDNISTIFPIFFLAVAALVCLTTMARMVEEFRTEIGTFKALGYNERQIENKFLIYSLTATVIGSFVGLAVCFKLIPTVIYDAYCIMYDLPSIIAPFHWDVAIPCCIVAMLCVFIVTRTVCRKVLRETPASIMRPKAPVAGKRILLEKIPALWSRLSFSHKITARNLFRYRGRVLMTIIGIAGCSALVLTGFGLNDAIGDIIRNQFNNVFRYDLIAGYAAETTEDEQELFASLDANAAITEWMPQYRSTVTALGGAKGYEVNLTVSEDYTRLENFLSLQDRVTGADVTSPAEGVVVTEKVATLIDLQPGDSLTLKDGDNREFTVTVVGITENYASHFVYLSAEYYEEVFGEAPEYNSVIINLKNRDRWRPAAEKLLAEGHVQMVSSSVEMLEQYKNVTDNLGYVVGVLIVAAALLAFVVLYNLSNINITERTREIATLKVLGFYDNEVSAYIYRENVVLTILGTAFGLLLGVALTRFVVSAAEVDSIMFGRTIYPMSFLIAAVLTFLFSAIVNFVMNFHLKKISMVESMKSVD